MKSKFVLLALVGAGAIKMREPQLLDLSKEENPLDELSEKEIKKDHENEMMQMWSDTVDGAKGAKSAAEIAQENVSVQKKNAEIKLSGAGADVTDWSKDDTYFNRIFKQYSTAKMKADGSESKEKIISKDDTEKALTEILMAKIDTGKDMKKANTEVSSMM